MSVSAKCECEVRRQPCAKGRDGLLGWALGCVFLFLGWGQGYAQTGEAPYLGGIGDGYDRATATLRVPGDPLEHVDSAFVYPSRLRRGVTAHVMALGLANKLEVRVHDMAGNIAWQFTQWNLRGNHDIELPTGGLAAGTYLIEVRRDGRVETKKMVVTEE